MNYKFLVLLLFFCTTASLYAQPPEKKPIRIADTLTQQEKNNHNRVILRSELDSLIGVYNAGLPQKQVQEPVQELKKEIPMVFILSATGGLLIIAFLFLLLFYNQKRYMKTMAELRQQLLGLEFTALTPATGTSKSKSSQHLEKKIGDMHAEIDKLQSRNLVLEQSAKEYKLVKQNYESVKQQLAEVYKMKNYPGYDSSKAEAETMKGLLDTERSVASYAYERFLKPVLTIADAHKNSPANITKEESEKLLQLLISLSLLYIEYLYLRINDLSIGGNMVQRIQGLARGNGLDPALLKQLNTEHGSRALVIRMVLDAMNIQKLSYPVFDETNLNLS